MNEAYAFAVAVLALTFGLFAQNEPIFRAEVKNAFVWGEDSPMGAVSSTIQDPLTGNAIHKLSYGGVEVSSRLGFERTESANGVFLNYTTTVVNATEAKVSLRYGGISVEGHAASPVKLVPTRKKFNKPGDREDNQDALELQRMHCFTSGFLLSDNFFFSEGTSSQVLTVAPHTAFTVSTIIRDPRRYHSILCSTAGCYPTGTIRYYVRVDNHDYVFAWPGRSAVYCGK